MTDHSGEIEPPSIEQLFQSVGGYWFICEAGHRVRSIHPDMQFCPVPLGSVGLETCGRTMEYRLIDYYKVASVAAQFGRNEPHA